VFISTAVSFDLSDPGPGKGDGSFSVSKTDHQQLIPKANLGTVYDQSDFSQMSELHLQPLSSDGLS
jgi:hypothetical protein